MMSKDSQLDKTKSAVKVQREKNKLAELKLHSTKIAGFQNHLNRNLKFTRKRKSGWTTPDRPERDMSTKDRKVAMSNARQKIEESPITKGLVQTLADNVAGSGFRLRMRTKNQDWNDKVEELWRIAKDKLDIRGVRRWGALNRMWHYRKVLDGDVGILLVNGGKSTDEFDEGKWLSFLQTIEAERIAKNPQDSEDVGIDFNLSTGRPKKYYVFPAMRTVSGQIDKRRRGKPIDPNKFIHYANFPQERAERKRGVSQLVQNMEMMKDLEDIIENMLQKVKNESFIAMNFGVEPAPDGSLFGSEIEEVREAEDGKKRRHVKMVPGMTITTGQGEKLDLVESKNPSTNWEKFIRLIIRFMGMPLGMPLEIMLLDFADTNFSGGRSILELAKRRWRIDQDDLGHVCSRAFQWWLSREVKLNDLKAPTDLDGRFWTHGWGKPGWPYIDPLKLSVANKNDVGLVVKSRTQIIDETTGGEFEDVADEIEKEEKIMKDKGIQFVVGKQTVTSTAPTVPPAT